MRTWNAVKTMMLLAALTALFMGIGYALGGSLGALIALVFAGGMNFYTYWNADKIVLKMHDAREVDARTAPQLYGLVETLVRRAGMPMPKVYLVDQPHPNAFATGRNPENAAVAATSGLLRILEPDEVEAVMAHELAHVQNRDTLIMTMAATIAGAIAMIANFAFFFGGNNRSNIFLIILAMLVAPFAAMILQLALSRAREFGADRGGAALCGNPRALATALAKLDQAAKRIPSPVAQRDPAAASLYIVPGLGRRLFSTHPRTEDRVAALMALEPQSGTPESGGRSGGRAPSALDPFGRR
jgi:heat shock protein HtpX